MSKYFHLNSINFQRKQRILSHKEERKWKTKFKIALVKQIDTKDNNEMLLYSH